MSHDMLAALESFRDEVMGRKFEEQLVGARTEVA